MFACSSSEVLNTLFEDIGRTVDEVQGLKKLAIEMLMDQNTLEEWPLSQLVLKSQNLEYLKI